MKYKPSDDSPERQSTGLAAVGAGLPAVHFYLAGVVLRPLQAVGVYTTKL